jgi:hypothetical protein
MKNIVYCVPSNLHIQIRSLNSLDHLSDTLWACRGDLTDDHAYVHTILQQR